MTCLYVYLIIASFLSSYLRAFVAKEKMEHKRIHNPDLHVVLYQPEIPANTGNIARLCGAAEVCLHLIHPLGFRVDDKHLRRAGLDYWDEVDIRQYESLPYFLEFVNQDNKPNVLAFSKKAPILYTQAKVKRGSYLLFGPETRGLPDELTNDFPCYRIPIRGRVRSLNLSTSVGILVYHYLYQLKCF
jgi:tRNA (cytidine/uridine-2'-O-)-methyltransferase